MCQLLLRSGKAKHAGHSEDTFCSDTALRWLFYMLTKQAMIVVSSSPSMVITLLQIFRPAGILTKLISQYQPLSPNLKPSELLAFRMISKFLHMTCCHLVSCWVSSELPSLIFITQEYILLLAQMHRGCVGFW